ncbi:MAG: adenylyl-sulfate kinase [Geminicoccaceae bacterium]
MSLRSERFARELLDKGEFVEIHVDTLLTVAEDRDAGRPLQEAARARSPISPVSSSYEAPDPGDPPRHHRHDRRAGRRDDPRMAEGERLPRVIGRKGRTTGNRPRGDTRREWQGSRGCDREGLAISGRPVPRYRLSQQLRPFSAQQQ